MADAWLTPAGTSPSSRGRTPGALRARGLVIESPLGDVHVPTVKAPTILRPLGPVDVVFFTVKRMDTQAALQQMAPLIGPGTMVVPFPNGVDTIDVLTHADAHVAGGTAYVAAVIREPGIIRHTAMDRLVFGPLNGPPPRALEELRDLGKQAKFDAVLSERIQVDVWAKFVRLSVFSGMTAAARCSIGPIRQDPDLRALMETAWHESILVARAKQVPLPSTIFADIEAATAALPPGARSSMLEDLERGRRLELPWLSGAVVRIADEVGVDVPTHRLIVTLLKPHVNGRLSS